ncbi:MAG TPA: glycoside hydrolase family 16 protein [Marmoricola sp.]|nr:glycoside hydrolase family 16 protein [Marmoricola sp.]
MALIRARGVALLVGGALAAVLALSLGVATPATAAGRGAPTVSLQQSGDGTVTVAGRTPARSAKLRIVRRVGARWVLAARTHSHRHRYAATLFVAPGSAATFKVISNRRSRTFTVRTPAVTPTAPPAEPAKPQPIQYDACGARPHKADGTLWSCTFHDDFDGTALDPTKWVPQTAFLTGDPNGAFACYTKSPNNVSVADGMLSLTVRKEAAPQPCGSPDSTITSSYTSGSVATYQLFSQEYGRYEARIRNTATTESGLQETFWLWPDERDGAIDPRTGDTGEIDVSETYSNYSSVTVPRLHYAADPNSDPGVNTANCDADRGVWNTYTLEWTPTTITVFVNGHLCLTNTSADPVFHRRHIILLTQALGDANNPVTDATPIPATMDIDYVRVWQ